VSGHDSKGGFTLLEMTMAMTIMGVALAGAAMVSKSGSEAYRTGAATTQLEQNLHRALLRAADEISATGAALLVPDPLEGLAYDDLYFQPVIGFSGASPDLGPSNRLVAELEPSEAPDGIDNDGDGLVDERELVLVRDAGGAGEQRVVLCRGVLEYLEGETFNGADDNGNGIEDEPGFHFERNGNVMTIRLSLGGQDHLGRVFVRTAELDARMRN
jgi:prepilin-type N-terminal cleavage/methylation domain-containing protein